MSTARAEKVEIYFGALVKITCAKTLFFLKNLLTNLFCCDIILSVEKIPLGICVTVARQTLTLFVGVRTPHPQPKKGYKKDIAAESLDFSRLFCFFRPWLA